MNRVKQHDGAEEIQGDRQLQQMCRGSETVQIGHSLW